ncbi:MAG: NAD(P)-dependent alcohol dehydrogenase [Bacteroidetes bacterium]|nr:NAD(P)-dependent alcohol dehydrogenase [Bacteroidota bacterium]
MKAVICNKYGSPGNLKIGEVDKPTPTKNEVLVKIHVSTVTTGDCRIIKFDWPYWFWIPGRLMFGITKPRRKTPGWELAGEIESIGSNVTNLKKGNFVFGYTEGMSFGGTNTEYKSISASRLVKINPSEIDPEKAAVLPIGGLTALYLLRKAKLVPGQKVLIYGASGSVGTFAIQIAKLFGVEVTAVCSQKNHELVKSLGADEVIDYRKDDFTKNGIRYDAIFDTVSKISFAKVRRSITESGSYLTVDWPLHHVLLAAFTGKQKIFVGMVDENINDMIYLMNLVQEGKLNPFIDKSYSLDEAVEAYKYVSTGRKRGNVVIKTI